MSHEPVHKLNDLNYNQWKTNIIGLLMKENLLKYIKKDGNLAPTDAALVERWQIGAEKANGIILASIGATQIKFVDYEQDALTNWTSLAEEHQSHRASNIENLKEVVLSRRQQGKKLKEHLKQFTEAMYDFESVGGQMKELEKCRALLKSLDSQWNQFKSIMDTSEDVINPVTGKMMTNLLTYKTVLGRLREADTLMDPTIAEEANWTATPGNWKADLSCENCGGIGHDKNCSSGKRPDGFKIMNTKKYVQRARDDNYARRRYDQKDKPKEVYKESARQSLEDEGWMTTLNEERNAQSYLDSCCTTSLFNDLKYFTNYTSYDHPRGLGTYKATPTDGGNDILGEGKAVISIIVDGIEQHVIISRALFVPTARNNLLSTGQLKKEGYSFIETQSGLLMKRDGTTIAKVTVQENNLFLIENTSCASAELCNFVETKGSISYELMHKRLGHMSMDRMKQLAGMETVKGFNMASIPPIVCICAVCRIAKAKALPHKAYDPNKTYELLELIVADYKGPMDQSSLLNRNTGYCVYKDAGSRHAVIFLVSSKDEQVAKFKEYKAFVEKKTGKTIKNFRHDRGGEYMGASFQAYLRAEGIQDQTTASHSPESNSISESHIRLLDHIAKSMLVQAQLPKIFWGEAMLTANYLYNRSPTQKLVNTTPHEALTGEEPRIDHLRVFGCKAFVFIPKKTRRPLDYSGKIARFVGYGANSQTYKLYDGASFKFIESRDVKFDEFCFKFHYRDCTSTENSEDVAWIPISNNSAAGEDDVVVIQTDVLVSDATTLPAIDPESDSNDQTTVSITATECDHNQSSPSVSNNETSEDSDNSSINNENSVPQLLSMLGNYWSKVQPRRRVFDTDNLDDSEEANLVHDANSLMDSVPSNYGAMLKHPDKSRYIDAMLEERNSLHDKEVYEVVSIQSLPGDTVFYNSTWIFTRKDEVNPPRYKARLCARGDQETKSDDLSDYFASVLRTENLKILLTITATMKWMHVTIDVKTAFLNAKRKHPVYMKIPVGWELDRKLYCLKITKALYGLRSSPADWQKELTTTLLEAGYTQLKSDWNIFRKVLNQNISILAFHVDDGTISASNAETMEHFITTITSKYDITIDRNPTQYLKIEISRDFEGQRFYLSQEKYITASATLFKVLSSNPVSTPMESGFVNGIQDFDNDLPEQTPFRSIMGCLLQLAKQTRPDVMLSVTTLCQHLHDAKLKHWNAAKRILIYLYHTRTEKLELGNLKGELILEAYSDATWGDDVVSRLSRSGGVIFLNGSLITCWSKLQKSHALSSTQAEYQAMALAAQEIIYFRHVLTELGFTQKHSTILNGDNQGALDLSVSTKHHPRMKHIDIKYHFLRDEVQKETLKVKYVSTDDQIADIFTKPLQRMKFNKFKSMLNVGTIKSGGVLGLIPKEA